MTKQRKIIKMFAGLSGIILGIIFMVQAHNIPDWAIICIGLIIGISGVVRFLEVYKDEADSAQ